LVLRFLQQASGILLVYIFLPVEMQVLNAQIGRLVPDQKLRTSGTVRNFQIIGVIVLTQSLAVYERDDAYRLITNVSRQRCLEEQD